jgi:hypothetical protein
VFGSWQFAWKEDRDISRAGKGGLAAQLGCHFDLPHFGIATPDDLDLLC